MEMHRSDMDRLFDSLSHSSILSACRIALPWFFGAVIVCLASSARGRLAFLDEGHHTQRDNGADPRWKQRRILSHRLLGTLNFLWLFFGTCDFMAIWVEESSNYDNHSSYLLFYDVVL